MSRRLGLFAVFLVVVAACRSAAPNAIVNDLLEGRFTYSYLEYADAIRGLSSSSDGRNTIARVARLAVTGESGRGALETYSSVITALTELSVAHDPRGDAISVERFNDPMLTHIAANILRIDGDCRAADAAVRRFHEAAIPSAALEEPQEVATVESLIQYIGACGRAPDAMDMRLVRERLKWCDESHGVNEPCKRIEGMLQ